MKDFARRAGIVLQGLVLGLLLAAALLNLVALSSGTQLFRYQGF